MFKKLFSLASEFHKQAQDLGEAQWIYHVDIFEPDGAGTEYPVVRHSFYGKTKEEAKGYFESHIKTDAFMKGCVEKDKFKQIKCQSKFSWEKIENE